MDFQQHKTPVEESVFTIDLSEVPDARLGNGFVCCVYWASLSKPHIDHDNVPRRGKISFFVALV